jgi:hypothetical protein
MIRARNSSSALYKFKKSAIFCEASATRLRTPAPRSTGSGNIRTIIQGLRDPNAASAVASSDIYQIRGAITLPVLQSANITVVKMNTTEK